MKLKKTHNDWIAIERIQDNKTESGIIIPDLDPMAEYHIGVVRIPNNHNIKVNTKVMYRHYRNFTWTEEGLTFELVKKDDIIGEF